MVELADTRNLATSSRITLRAAGGFMLDLREELAELTARNVVSSELSVATRRKDLSTCHPRRYITLINVAQSDAG